MKYKSFHFNFKPIDIGENTDLVIDEHSMKINLKYPLEQANHMESPFNKQQKTDLHSSNLIKNVSSMQSDEIESESLPINLRSISDEMISLFPKLLPALAESGNLEMWFRFNKLLSEKQSILITKGCSINCPQGVGGLQAYLVRGIGVCGISHVQGGVRLLANPFPVGWGSSKFIWVLNFFNCYFIK